jgi:two-component system, NarL family, sensor histidine kinase EvgS
MLQTILAVLGLFLGLFLFSPIYAADHNFLSPEEVVWLQQHKAPIKVHNEDDWKPFNFNDAGKPKGYSIDYIQLVAEKLGIQIEFVSGPSWSEFLEMMQNGSLDIMVNIASTKERRNYLRFTEPYFITKTYLFVRNSDNSISDLNDLAGKKIGFTKGFFFGEFIHKSYPEIEIITFDSTLESLIGVEKGVVDAAIEVPFVAQKLFQEEKLNTVKRGGVVTDPRFITTFSIATHKDNLILSSIIQKGMDAVSSEEELLIRKKWKIEERKSSLISEDEEAYLSQLNALTVCVNPNRLPLEAVNIDGTLTGISSEFTKLLYQRMKTPFTIVKTKNWGETLKLAQKGDCDLLPMITKTKQRQEYLNFTTSWLTTPMVVATRQDQIYISSIEQVTNQTFGVVRDLATNEILHLAYPELKLVNVQSISKGLKKVKDGILFGFIGTLPTISRTLQTENITKVKISGDVGLNVGFAIGVKKSDKQLLGIVEKSLATIDKSQVTNIYNRWLTIAYIDRFDYTRFWQLVVIFVIFILYLLYRYRRGLQITAELRQAHAEVELINLKLTEQARTDTLTQIANRLRIDEELYLELTRFKRTNEFFSVILLDIDNFKKVNDNHGHHIGDMVLKSIATILSDNTRPYDLTGRWGGEEFLVICPSTTHKGILCLAEHLRIAIMNSNYEKLPSQTASFGVATVKDNDSVKELISRADKALYRAKKGGRNRVEL